MKKSIPLISVGFHGFSLVDTLKGLSKTMSREVCLCCVDGFTQHVVPEDMTQQEWAHTKDLLNTYGLSFFGLEGHCDVSEERNMQKIRKRMEFTRFMNGRYMDANAGPRGSEREFYKQIDEIIRKADDLDLTFCLETHGDIIDSAEGGAKVLKEINSERIRISYDPANVYFYSNGEIDPIEDIKYSPEYIGLLHFKGISHNQSKTKWSFPFMRDSIFDYDEFFNSLKMYGYSGMIALEIEKIVTFEKERGFIKEPGWSEKKIVDAYNTEIEFLRKKLTWFS